MASRWLALAQLQCSAKWDLHIPVVLDRETAGPPRLSQSCTHPSPFASSSRPRGFLPSARWETSLWGREGAKHGGRQMDGGGLVAAACCRVSLSCCGPGERLLYELARSLSCTVIFFLPLFKQILSGRGYSPVGRMLACLVGIKGLIPVCIQNGGRRTGS